MVSLCLAMLFSISMVLENVDDKRPLRVAYAMHAALIVPFSLPSFSSRETHEVWDDGIMTVKNFEYGLVSDQYESSFT